MFPFGCSAGNMLWIIRQDMMSLTNGAFAGFRCVVRNFHPAMAVAAFIAASTPDLAIAASNLNRPALDERLRGLAARGFDYPPECLPRYVHPFSRLFLIQSFEISQPHCLELVESEHKRFSFSGQIAGLRLENPASRRSRHSSAALRPCHIQQYPFLGIMSICS